MYIFPERNLVSCCHVNCHCDWQHMHGFRNIHIFSLCCGSTIRVTVLPYSYAHRYLTLQLTCPKLKSILIYVNTNIVLCHLVRESDRVV